MRIATLLATLALSTTALAQQDFSKVQIKTTKLSETTYMMEGAGGNLGLSIGEDAVFLVDDQFAPMTPKILAAIKALTPKPVKFVLNTHWHFDHTGGNENLGKEGAIIVAHDNVRKRMGSEQLIELLNMPQKPSPKAALPMVTFAADVRFHINGDEVAALHMPRAHTDGDAVVHFLKSDVIHMGDIYFNGMYPFIDTSSGGSVDGVIAAVDKVLAIAGERTKIIPGHGPLATKADLKGYRDMLATASAKVRTLVQAGKKWEEIVAAKPNADLDATWGKGFIKPEKFSEMLAKDLARPR